MDTSVLTAMFCSRSADYNWSYILYFVVSFVTGDVLNLSFPTGEILLDGPI